jgi:hypothetical protein
VESNKLFTTQKTTIRKEKKRKKNKEENLIE